MEELERYPLSKTETAKGRTYGECIMDEIMSIRMIDGDSHYIAHQRKTQTAQS